VILSLVSTAKGDAILAVGEPFTGEDESKRVHRLKGGMAAWPVRKDGRLGIWRVEGPKLMELFKRGYAYVSSRDDARDTWTIKYLMSGTLKAKRDDSWRLRAFTGAIPLVTPMLQQRFGRASATTSATSQLYAITKLGGSCPVGRQTGSWRERPSRR
jgi:hypothetical protein